MTTPVSDEDKPFEVPEGWEWCRIKDVCQTCLGKMLDKSKNKGTLQPYLRNVNVRWGTFDLSNLLEMPFVEEEERYSLTSGDIVVCEGGEPGRCAIWKYDYSIKFQKALHRVRCYSGIINTYLTSIVLEWYVNSQNISKYYTGATIKHLTSESLNSISIPLPPLSEQQRIVTKIEQIFAQLDSIAAAIKS